MLTTHTFDAERGGGFGNGRRGLYGIGVNVGRGDKAYCCAVAADNMSARSSIEGFMACCFVIAGCLDLGKCSASASHSESIGLVDRAGGGVCAGFMERFYPAGRSHDGNLSPEATRTGWADITSRTPAQHRSRQRRCLYLSRSGLWASLMNPIKRVRNASCDLLTTVVVVIYPIGGTFDVRNVRLTDYLINQSLGVAC